MPKYNHAYTISFSVENDNPEGACPLEQMKALQEKLSLIATDKTEFENAFSSAPFDTYEVEE
jgi:hypothetical protein